MNNTIAAVDIGYSDVKVIIANEDGEITKLFKFPSVIGEVKINSSLKNVGDNRVVNYKNKSYYVGNDALKLPSEDILDMITYEEHEEYSPVFLHKVFEMIGYVPDKVVLGLSIAFLNQSARYESIMKSFKVNGKRYNLNILLLPQGIMSKLAVDKYGMNLLGKDNDIYQNYTYVDCGFNTVDVFRVIDGESSLSLSEGLPELGIVTIARDLKPTILANHKLDFSIDELAEILVNGYFLYRGKKVDVSTEIKYCIDNYMIMLMKALEDKYGKVFQKDKHLILSGGGSYIFKKYGKTDDFVISPNNYNEYYNTAGYIIYGIKNPELFSSNVESNITGITETVE